MLLIFASLYMLANSEASSYELSIYNVINPLVWIFLVLSIIGGIIIITEGSFIYRASPLSSVKRISNNFWMIGFLILIMANFVILSVSVFRGYYIYGRGDIMTHLGITKEIISHGYTPYNDFYPVSHIILAQLSVLTNVSYILISRYISVIYSIFYMMFIYCLSKSLFNDKRYYLIATEASVVIFFCLFQTNMYPHLLSVLTLPLLYYLYIKSSGNPAPEFKIIMVIVVLLYPFYHPITALMVIFFFIVLAISKMVNQAIERKTSTNDKKGSSFNIVLLSIISFTIWIFSFSYLRGSLRYLFGWLSGEASYLSQTTQVVGILDKLGLSIFDIIMLVFRMLGDDLIYIILSSIAIIMLFVQSKSDESKCKNLLYMGVWYICGILLSVMFFISYHIHDPYRVLNLNFIMTLTPSLAGYSIFKLTNRKNATRYGQYIAIAICIILIIIPTIIGIFSLYPSPYIDQPNSQITQTEVNGMTWLFSNKDRDVKTREILSITYRFADLIMGYKWQESRTDISTKSVDKVNAYIPDHFGYQFNSTLGGNISTSCYTITTDYDRSVYSELWGSIGKFTEEDFKKYSNDGTVNRLYTNGGFEIGLVQQGRND